MVQVEVSLDPDAGLVLADPDRVRQVMWNLLSNAVKFTPPGGSVQVQLGREHGQVRIRIADTGQGISSEFLPHVFERPLAHQKTAPRRTVRPHRRPQPQT